MHLTIFDTPLVNICFKAGSHLFFKLAGWKITGALPADARKAVLIAAPHTSNWDLPYTLMVCFVLNLRPYWMGKSSIFKFPFNHVMQWLGGIAVNREKSTNLVAASAQAIEQSDRPVQLLVPPEGTRSAVRTWKTGFYYIALQAKVPVVMAYMDYSRKEAGLGPLFYPSGDIDKDMAAIKAFYAPFKGKRVDKFEG